MGQVSKFLPEFLTKFTEEGDEKTEGLETS